MIGGQLYYRTCHLGASEIGTALGLSKYASVRSFYELKTVLTNTYATSAIKSNMSKSSKVF